MQTIVKALKKSPLGTMLRTWHHRRQMVKWGNLEDKQRVFYSQFVRPGDLCFDVGANLGNRLKVFLSLDAKVVAVEPQQQCMYLLRRVYGDNEAVTLVNKALGAVEGEGIIKTSVAHTLSSLSSDWIEAVKKSGRFAQQTWDNKQTVQITTLDQLIEDYGLPSFIKIDVEGFEEEVVKGLSQPVPMLSLEFTPEFLQSTVNCIAHLSQLAEIQMNYSLGETACLVLPDWISHQDMLTRLEDLADNHQVFGDVYIRSV